MKSGATDESGIMSERRPSIVVNEQARPPHTGEQTPRAKEVSGMSGVRVLVGTRKGAFVLTSDAKRERWDVAGPHFAGWEIYHLIAVIFSCSPARSTSGVGWYASPAV